MKSKEQKQNEAAERQSAARTPEEQLAYLDKMGFAAVKERAKIAERMKPPVPKTPRSEKTKEEGEKKRKGKATPKGKAAKKKS